VKSRQKKQFEVMIFAAVSEANERAKAKLKAKRRGRPVRAMKSGDSASLLAQEVGRRVKEARLQRGWSRRYLGALLGISGQQIHKYETGQDALSLHRLLSLARFFGVSPDTFWNQMDTTTVTPDASGAADISTVQLVRAYRRIASAKLRNRFLQLVKQIAGKDEESINS